MKFLKYLWLACCFVLGMWTSSCVRHCQELSYQREAVKHGGAHWETSVDGEVSFHWNDETPIKP